MCKSLFIAITIFLYSCSVPDLPEYASNSHFQVYPNPAREYVFINVNNSGSVKYQVKVVAPDGTFVFQDEVNPGENGAFSIPLQDRAEGYYYAILDTGKENVIRKFVKR